MKNLINNLKENKVFEKDERVAVAVSGGADSVALLYFLQKNSKQLNITPVCLNIDHSIRGDESKRDSDFVKKLAKSLGVEFFHEKINVPEYATENKLTTEQAARILRYQSLFSMADSQGIKKICVGHHKDDQAETVLMHIFRGSGLKGAAGMSVVSLDRIVRPFLQISRDEIESYLKENNIKYITDSTNEDIEFSRNFLRHNVMKKVEKIYPTVIDSLVQFADICRMDEEFINSCVPYELLKCNKNEILIEDRASGLHSSLFSRLIREAFFRLDALVDMEQKHITLVAELFGLQVGKMINLPNQIIAQRDYHGVLIFKDKKLQSDLVKELAFGKIEFGDWGNIEIAEHIGKPDYSSALFVDADKLPKGSVVRTRKNNDKFTKFGSGTKNLSDYLIDIKIPKRERDILPVIASGSTVYVVVGSEISEEVKVDKDTKKTIKISYSKGK